MTKFFRAISKFFVRSCNKPTRMSTSSTSSKEEEVLKIYTKKDTYKAIYRSISDKQNDLPCALLNVKTGEIWKHYTF